MTLAGRTALVTGGGVRIGRAIALRLAAAGARVGVHYHSSGESAEEVVRLARDEGAMAIALSADLLERPVEAARQLVTDCSLALGPIDLLVNSAAIFEAGSLDDTTADNWDRHLRLNLQAPVFLTQEFARQLPGGQRGDVVNILDWRALRPCPGHLAYTAAKAGLAGVTRLLAQELGPQIRVNGIAPGAILPPPGGVEATWKVTAEEKNPLGIIGHPDEIARTVIFLATAEFITGEIVHVTGGQQL